MTKVLNNELPRWSDAERRIMHSVPVCKEKPLLESIQRRIEIDGFMEETVWEYIIPFDREQEILERYYPFYPCPDKFDYRHCLHEDAEFQVREYKLIYFEDIGYQIVSPYFFKSGGMAIDWVDRKEFNADLKNM